eukprot:6486814-Amphidinium_carterae.2
MELRFLVGMLFENVCAEWLVQTVSPRARVVSMPTYVCTIHLYSCVYTPHNAQLQLLCGLSHLMGKDENGLKVSSPKNLYSLADQVLTLETKSSFKCRERVVTLFKQHVIEDVFMERAKMGDMFCST